MFLAILTVLVFMTVAMGFVRSYVATELTAPTQGWLPYFEQYHAHASEERRAILKRQLKVLHACRRAARQGD